VATLCGRTVVRARQYDVAQRALAAQHILAEASRLLEERHELETTLRAVAALTVPAIADVCVMCLLDERGALRPVVAVTHDDERRAVVDQLIARQPVISNPGLLDVISTAITTHAQVVDRRGDEGVAEDEEHLQLIRALDATSGIVVPLIGPERISGLVLLLVTGDRAPLGQPSLQLAEALASRIAVAVHNTAAYSTLDRRVGQLQQALESRVVIEQAKGVLVARWGITPTAAFHHMRAATRSRRMRIHDLATAVIDGTDDLPAPGTG
jgi:transcriptional regulator with GAF, ATPase, and Fis domain